MRFVVFPIMISELAHPGSRGAAASPQPPITQTHVHAMGAKWYQPALTVSTTQPTLRKPTTRIPGNTLSTVGRGVGMRDHHTPVRSNIILTQSFFENIWKSQTVFSGAFEGGGVVMIGEDDGGFGICKNERGGPAMCPSSSLNCSTSRSRVHPAYGPRVELETPPAVIAEPRPDLIERGQRLRNPMFINYHI